VDQPRVAKGGLLSRAGGDEHDGAAARFCSARQRIRRPCGAKDENIGCLGRGGPVASGRKWVFGAIWRLKINLSSARAALSIVREAA